MNPILTTITPYWDRPEMLTTLLKSLSMCEHPEVNHLIFCVGGVPNWAHAYASDRILLYTNEDKPPRGIGHYHNLGARCSKTEWIMKLDVDCLPHTQFFQELVPMLKCAQPREWFNVGMFYIDRNGSSAMLGAGQMPITVSGYHRLADNHSKLPFPAGTNFVCRRQSYLDLGGCEETFNGYGWEDYQQIYMLERHWLGEDPLPGPLDEANVTNRCRDEISRHKAIELIKANERLALIHRFHQPVDKDPLKLKANRAVLYNYVMMQRTKPLAKVICQSMTQPSLPNTNSPASPTNASPPS